jgi:hypothetical protein
LEVCLELKCSISVLDNLYEQSALHIAAEADPQMIPVLLEAQMDRIFCMGMKSWNKRVF